MYQFGRSFFCENHFFLKINFWTTSCFATFSGKLLKEKRLLWTILVWSIISTETKEENVYSNPTNLIVFVLVAIFLKRILQYIESWFNEKLGTLFENDSITDINYPELFSLFHIDTWWGQSKYVRKFEISQTNFEKNSKFVDIENFSLNFIY